MQKETKKKLCVIGASFLGGVLITLLVVWLTAIACPCKKRHARPSIRRPGVERQLEMQNHRHGRHAPMGMEARPDAQKGKPVPAQPMPAPEKAQ